jgi:hypothetical protein
MAITAPRLATRSIRAPTLKIGTVNYTHTDPTLNFATGFTLDNDGFVRVREI